MKVLRIYDHLGELKKEFNLYVEGEDFRWQASYPEVIWFGAIILEEGGKEPEAMLTPELKPEDVEEEIERRDRAFREAFPEEPEVIEPEVIKEEEELEQAPFLKGIEEDIGAVEKEVKDATKRSHRKRSRVKRSTPPVGPESTERLHQDDTGGDTNQGD